MLRLLQLRRDGEGAGRPGRDDRWERRSRGSSSDTNFSFRNECTWQICSRLSQTMIVGKQASYKSDKGNSPMMRRDEGVKRDG